MGNILNVSEQLEDPHATSHLAIVLDLARPVCPHLNQLLFWSLEEIRNIYAPFRKRKSSPLLSRSQFLRFVRLSRISAFHIYDSLCVGGGGAMSAFEVVGMLVLGAFTTTSYKVQFLFNVFDLLSLKTLKFADLMLMFKSVVRAYAYLTAQPLPDVQLLDNYAQTVFSRADLNNDQNLNLSEIMTWLEENRDASELFKRFEPKVHGKEHYHIFNSFAPYKQQEIDLLLGRIRKVHAKLPLVHEDYQLLRTTTPPLPRARPTHNNENEQPRSEKLSVGGLKDKQDKQERGGLRARENSGGKGRRGFSNIIIIKGRTITKREIFDLREYFDKLSGGKQCILIEDFIDSFSQEKYNHMKSVAASLYNFLDHDQNGRVSFQELLLKIYPNLTPHHIRTIATWIDDYNLNFNLATPLKPPPRQDETKKRVLPKACLPRFQEMFAFYDRTHKGYIDLQDMRKVLSEVCSEKEIAELFEDSDRDCDGRLSLLQFGNLILPMDLEIEGLQ